MSNIKLPDGVYVDLYTAAGISPGVQVEVLNITPNDISLFSTVIEPVGTEDHVPLQFGRGTGRNDVGDLGAWAICSGGGAIDVREV